MKEIYSAPHLNHRHYQVSLDEQEKLLGGLTDSKDAESERLQRYVAMPDLTRLPGNPVRAITDIVLALPTFKGFDIIDTPEVIPAEIVFDLFNFPPDHPARSRSDTYYVDGTNILRPHTSLMWKYYLDLPEVQQQLSEHGSAGALSYGKVYRRDEIDWQHTNVLHHIDGLFICRKDIKEITQKDLEDILLEVARALYGEEVQYKFAVDSFPYTDPSLEMMIAWNDEWVEILGAGIVHPAVIRNLGLDPEVYNGWAFGFGADRLAMLKLQIPDIRLLRSEDPRVVSQFGDINTPYQVVSKYPPAPRDISFIVSKDKFNINAWYELARTVVGDEFIEEIKLLDNYDNAEKFGEGNTSYTFRVNYRHLDRTLTNDEVDVMHGKLEAATKETFDATIR